MPHQGGISPWTLAVFCSDLTSFAFAIDSLCQVGLSGVGRLFTDGVLTEMGRNNERPIIMPMSNPVTNMECSHSRAQRFTGEPL